MISWAVARVPVRGLCFDSVSLMLRCEMRSAVVASDVGFVEDIATCWMLRVWFVVFNL